MLSMKKKQNKAISTLLREIRSQGLDCDEKVIKNAWEFAILAHTGQKRKTGEDYVYHPLEVARILVSWKLDQDSIVAGLLHDTIEDGGALHSDLSQKFGEDVASLVEGVTKVGDIRLKGSRDEEFVENLRKMFLAMAADLRVVIVKLADRLHNMRTLYALSSEKQLKIASETLDVYAPLAERLGMGEVKAELEDLSFPYVYPMQHDELKRESVKHYKEAGEYITKMKRTMLRALIEEGIKAQIQTRKKHLYSLWKKLQRPEIEGDFEKIYDMAAMRIIVPKENDCYVALGLVHAHYKPVPHLGVSDYIAQPKPNGYRSIHTKVFGPGKRIIEVQIRTNIMHEQAEYGVAAHWAYSEAKSKGVRDEKLETQSVFAPADKLNWVKQLVQWQNEIHDSKEYLEAVKFDAFGGRNFIFSPKGDVFDLPVGATPIDFAFAVHTHLGKYIKFAKVNERIVPLDHILKSGDVVEIIKSKSPQKPNKDWINFVATTLAKRNIRKFASKNGK